MTGGIPETISILDKSEIYKDAVWKILKKARMFKTIMGASIKSDILGAMTTSDGLSTEHAYYITKIAVLEVNSTSVRLIRLNNPWCGELEFKGLWCDESDAWNTLEEELREALQHKNLAKGEFWISFEDFYKNFHMIEFCNLTSDACIMDYIKDEHENLKWKLLSFTGEWTPGFTAGGCGMNNEALFWTNPQFLVNLKNTDSNDNLTTVLISLMQKSSVDRYGEAVPLEYIQFRFYRVKNVEDAEIAKKTGMRLYAGQLDRFGTSGTYTNSREVGKRYRVEPGSYLIIPSCYTANRKVEFLLRILTEQQLSNFDCKILENHKDNLSVDDLFYFTKYDIETNNSLLGFKNDMKTNETVDSSSIIIKSSFKPIKTPVIETFEKIASKEQKTHKNCVLM